MQKIHCVATIVAYHCHKIVKRISHCPVSQILNLGITECYKALIEVGVREAQAKHKPSSSQAMDFPSFFLQQSHVFPCWF